MSRHSISDCEQRICAALRTALADVSESACLHIAFSGGLDSHVLLHAMAQLLDSGQIANPLRAVHINHQLQTQSNEWETHCTAVAAGLNVPFDSIVIDVPAVRGASLEETARDARYAALAVGIVAGDILLSAHHADDQAETLLLQLLRGAGIAGLASMPVRRIFAQGEHLRPLLTVSRNELWHYAREKNLQWLEDPSNQCTDFARNYLRRQIFPTMQQRWPSLAKSFSSSAQHCAEAAQLVRDLARIDAEYCINEDRQIDIVALIKLSEARQKNLLRHWLWDSCGQFPSQNVLQAILRSVIVAKVDACPQVDFSGCSVRRYRGYLYFVREETSLPVDWFKVWRDPRSDLPLPALGVTLPAGLLKTSPAECVSDSITVRLRRGGEVLRQQGRPTKTLKSLLQEHAVPPWQRGRLPLIYCGDQLLVVYGLEKFKNN